MVFQKGEFLATYCFTLMLLHNFRAAAENLLPPQLNRTISESFEIALMLTLP